MSSPASFSSGDTMATASPSCGSKSSRAVAVVTNRWFREQRRTDQDATRMLTLLKQRKISCILRVESLQKGISKEGEGVVSDVERELEEIEQKMTDLEKDREDRSKRIMDRRVLQVTTLQELGLLEAAGKESRWRSESDLGGGSPGPSPGLAARHSPGASSSSSHASRKLSPPLLSARLRAGSDPSIARPDPSGRLHPATEEKPRPGLVAKLSPRLGRRNPLRMLSNAIDFRAKRKQRPKSADFENQEDPSCSSDTKSQSSASTQPGSSTRSASVTDILECVSLNPSQAQKDPSYLPLPPRVLEGRNSAPEMLVDNVVSQSHLPRNSRIRSRLTAAASAKQKLSTRFQPQRKQHHRYVQQSSASTSASVKRAKTFSLGVAGGGGADQPANYKTLPKQASSRSLGSTSTDSSQSSQSTGSSRKSSNSSNISDCSLTSAAKSEISQAALEEIAAFEKFISEYFEQPDNNNTITVSKQPNTLLSPQTKQKISASSILSEVLELSI